MLTRYGTCPGVKSDETEVQAWQRQQSYYGKQRAHRVFCPQTLLGQEDSPARNARELALSLISPAEDLVISCKVVGAEFPARVAELKRARVERAAQQGVEPGRTRIIIHHEPEGDLSVDAYNAKWDAAIPTLEAEADWLEPGTCHTAFWSRKVDENGVRANDWRTWIPKNPRVQRRLCFVSADLYPGAGRPTKSKPKYYEPPGPHPSPYGAWTEIGFCGILDEMVAELRSSDWPEVGVDIEAGIAEINHERANTAKGWPFTDANGDGCAEWLDAVLAYAYKRYAFVTYFHKGGGILTDRTPQVEAQVLKDWITTTYDDVDETEPEPGPEEPDPTDPQYGFGYDVGYDVGYNAGMTEGRIAGHADGVQEGRDEVIEVVEAAMAPYESADPA